MGGIAIGARMVWRLEPGFRSRVVSLVQAAMVNDDDCRGGVWDSM